MPDNFTNNVVTHLVKGLLTTDTLMHIKPGDGAKFALPIGDYAYITLRDKLNYEVVKYQIAGTIPAAPLPNPPVSPTDIITIVRAQDGTIARLSIILGVYDSDGALGFYPGARLFASPVLSNLSIGAPIVEHVLPSLFAVTGNHLYWLAVSINNGNMGAATVLGPGDTSTLSLGPRSSTSLGPSGPHFRSLISSTGAGAVPAPLPATSMVTSINRGPLPASLPHIILRVA
jgi:hypothetical protein